MQWWQVLYDKLLALLVSRRFWAAVTGVLIIFLQDVLGLDEGKAQWIAGILVAWIVGDSLNQTRIIRNSVFLVCAIVCHTSLMAQVQLAGQLEVMEHEPAVMESTFVEPVGASVLLDWKVDKPARGREFDGARVFAVWAPPGTYEVELDIVTAILVDGKIKLDKDEQIYNLVVKSKGPGPGPGPGPTPDVPTDQFDNIGQRTAVWAKTYLTTSEARQLVLVIASNYTSVAARLEGSQQPLIASIGDAAKLLVEANNAAYGSRQAIRDQFSMVLSRVAQDWDGRWPLNRAQVVAYWRAVAAGLESVR